MSKILVWFLWGFLMIIGVVLTIPYAILEYIVDKIDDWMEELELSILDNHKNKEEKDGRNAEF